ncbi:MAG: DUF4157 domain-containing protein [Myxococcota bacterium]|nr:DUF4157 domain-containing protein [Myxococcota bacterium]
MGERERGRKERQNGEPLAPDVAGAVGKRTLSDELESLGAGTPVDAVVRAPVEQQLGVSLADARVHDSAAARALAARHGARAFAYGTHIVLGADVARTDVEVLRHELTHVAQQAAGTPKVQALGGGADNAEAQAQAVAGQAAGAASETGRIVEPWVKPGEGQLGKLEILEQARTALSELVDQEMGITGNAAACPYIQQWFSKHMLRSAAEIERIAVRYSGLRDPRHAQDYIAPILKRVRAAITAFQAGGIAAIKGDIAAAGLGAEASEGAPGATAIPTTPQVQKIEASESGLDEQTADEARSGRGGAPQAVVAGLGEGEHLDPSTATRMGSALGRDVARVRVHRGAEATQLTRNANARAVAIGQDIAFAPNQYQPGTAMGDALLAHELAHTTQQRGGAGTSAGNEVSDEHDANQVGLSATSELGARDLDRGPQLQDQGLALRRCEDKPHNVTELRGKQAEDKLRELGGAIISDPDYSDGRKPLQGSQVRFILQPSNIPNKRMAGMWQWSFKTPGGMQVSAPNAQQPDPIPGVMIGPNGATPNAHDANATALMLKDVGKYSMDAHVRAGVATTNGAFDGFELHIERELEVVTTKNATAAAYGKLAGADKDESYEQFHDQMDMKLAVLRPGGPEKQNRGKYHLTTSAANPTPEGPGTIAFTAVDARTDKAKPLTYHWYVSPQSKEAPPPQLGGKPLVDVSGRKGYDFGAGSTIALPTNVGGLFVVWYQAKTDAGVDAGEAAYLQTILGTEDIKALEKHDKYIERADELGKQIEGAKVPVTGVHVSTANANETRLRLFMGKKAGDEKTFILIDLTPGLDPKANRLEYTSSTGKGAIDSFLSENKYPKGELQFRVGANSLGIPTDAHSRETTGMGFFDRLSTGLSVGGMAVLAGGLVLAPFTRGQSLQVAMVLSGALTAASGAVSLYERLQHAEVSNTGVALDVVMIASSLINAGGAVKSLRSGPGVMLSNRATKFLLWTNFIADGASGLLIAIEGAEQLAEIIDSKMPPEQKRAAIIRIVTNLIMAGGMLALSYGQLKEFRSRLSSAFGEQIAKGLKDDICITLGVVDDATLKTLKTGGAKEGELTKLAGALREEPALMNVIKGESRLAKILSLATEGTADDLRFAIMRTNALDAGVSAAASERLVTLFKGAKVDAAAAMNLPGEMLAKLGDANALKQLEGVGAAATAGTLKGHGEWMTSLLGKRGPDLESALSFGSEAAKASSHHKKVLDLSGKDPVTNGLVAERSDMRWQMEDKNRRLTAAGEPPRFTNLDTSVNAGMDNLAKARTAGHPYGFTDKPHFETVGAQLKADIASAAPPPGGRAIPANEVVVQGSAVHKVDAKDIDIAIMVKPDDFNKLIEQSFPKEVAKVRARGVDPFTMTAANATSSAEKTLAHAVTTGKITRDKVKPKLSDVRRATATAVGKDIDLSVIKKGGPFDRGPYFPFP